LHQSEERWDDPEWLRQFMAEIDAEVEAEEDPEDPHLVWLSQDRQRRVDSWAATFFAAGIIPPDGWQRWVT
jgi:hypothetical protein